MKLKLNLYITDPQDFLRDPMGEHYAVIPTRHMDASWTFVTEVEFDVNVDTSEMIQKASDKFDEAINEMEGRIEHLKNRKAELLALPNLS